MDQINILKQMVQFNKSAFDNTYSAMEMVRDQNERMLNAYMEQATWLPEEGKKSIRQWLDSYKKSCGDLKSVMDEGYQRVEQTLNKSTGSS